MSQTPLSEDPSSAPWEHSGSRPRVPDTSMLPGSEKTLSAAEGLLRGTVRGAHDTIDHLAERAEPLVRQLSEGLAAAEETLQAKTDKLRGTRDAWAASARSTVRDKPLACVTAALALGYLIARLSR